VRGGSWVNLGRDCRSVRRFAIGSNNSSNLSIGFRLARGQKWQSLMHILSKYDRLVIGVFY